MGRQVPTRAGVGASGPAGGTCLRQSCCLLLQAGWLSSGQTIGAVRTAVRSACCLPELRVANRLRRLCPLGDGELFKFYLKSSVCQRQTGLPKGNPPCVFPTFPPAPLRIATRSNRAQALLPRRSRRVMPPPGAETRTAVRSPLFSIALPLFGVPPTSPMPNRFLFLLFFRSRKEKKAPLL